jgi:antibiotic biosynthesis monooxygenase (ABM) superfamily enzyme
MTNTSMNVDAGQTGAMAAAPVRTPSPSKFRLASVMLVAIYPLVTAILYGLGPMTPGWQTWQRTLILAPLMVAMLVFVIAPGIHRHLGWFVACMPRPRR